MSKGLNDAEVAAEMKKMTEFIRQEAQEKAREIQVKVLHPPTAPLHTYTYITS
jgi:hypothetical protein